MNRYTFRLGDKKQSGIEMHVAVPAHTLSDAIRLANEQLYEQLDTKQRFRLDLDWGLTGHIEMNLGKLSEENLVSAEPIETAPASQMDLALEDDIPDELLFRPQGLGLVQLPA